MKRAIPWLVGVVILAGMMLACGGIELFSKLLLYTFAGWAFFLARVVPNVTFNWLYAGEAAIALTAFAFGVHWFAAWVYGATAVNRATPGDPEALKQLNTPARIWRPKWSISIVFLVIAMFVSGISMVGFTHNVMWLFTDPGPIIEGGGSGKEDRPRAVRKQYEANRRGVQ